MEQLRRAAAFANDLEIENGRVTGRVLGEIVDGARKAALLEEIAQREGVTLDQVIAIGDGANDLLMLAEAGTSVAYHAKPVVREKADYAIDYVGLDGLLALFPDSSGLDASRRGIGK